MSRYILVTGGAGYIGSHTCKALAEAGYVPVIYDNFIHGHRWAIKWGPCEAGDTTDKNRLKDVLKRYRPEAVIHFAAYAYVGDSVIKPAEYYRNNVDGSLSLLETMVEQNVKSIVFSSSCAVYGTPRIVPIDESLPENPISPYGRTKLIVENMLEDFSSAYGIVYSALRYFNASGSDPSGIIGEEHIPETHLIPLALQAALGVRPSVDIFGDDYETPDGTCIRDYIHVNDLAKAHILALEQIKKNGENLKCNLGTGNGYSVRQIISSAEEITGKKINCNVTAKRPGDPPVLVSDSKMAKQVLGWEPEYPDVADHIRHAWNWLLKHSGDKNQ